MVQHSPPQTSTGLKRKHIADEEELTLTLTYVPLLQTPPLHLAIMIAKDSPLIIDCPPSKRGGLTSAHSDLDAAIKKFRMTAYMWQALTAEDMRSKGLARRSFRLEEEWTTDTLSSTFFNSSLNSSNGSSHVGLKSSVRSTAKIHLIRSDKTVAELRDAKVAQQNPRVGEKRKQNLHKWFTAALKAAGGPFTDSARPVVAGLILDSHYDIENDLITAHAALGNSNPKGISLGMCGSHLTYSWPRFIEEVSACLLDTSEPGETVGNDNGECGTLWEAVSQHSLEQNCLFVPFHELRYCLGNLIALEINMSPNSSTFSKYKLTVCDHSVQSVKEHFFMKSDMLLVPIIQNPQSVA